MGNSWGQAIRRLTAGELEHIEQQRARWGPRFYSCATRGCEEHASFRTSYRYVTGRAGRVSDAERLACEEHGARFAAKHGLEVPTEPAPRSTRTGGMVAGELLRELEGRS